MENTLFSEWNRKKTPLADRMRPQTLDDFIGQEHVVGKGRLLRRAIMTDTLGSVIFFGPPGTGKTTLAHIISQACGGRFVKMNAVSSGVKELREVLSEAEQMLASTGKATYLLLDECHRWSKAQSDALLPALENGTVRFIGSTTENPMIAMTGAIVSRCRLFQFYPLKEEDIKTALLRALKDPVNGLGSYKTELTEGALEVFLSLSNGDCRNALNALELAVLSTEPEPDGTVVITPEVAEESGQKKVISLDDQLFYDMLSAFCKSLRGSDADAALAWFSRLIYAGCDPRIIARRLIAHASEDIGLANPEAMVQAVTAAQALEHIGLPEARLPLAQAIIYLCESPKSNAVVMAVDAAMAEAQKGIQEPVPLHLRDTSYGGAKAKLGAGTGYKYPHDFPGHYVVQQYMPTELIGHKYYIPGELGQEKKIGENHRLREEMEQAKKH